MFGRGKQSKEAKKRMEHLIYLAKERPDNIYDLTACELSKVPNGVYTVCKVLMKQSLLLHTNHLKSLNTEDAFSNLSSLRILDVHDNKLLKLPTEIKYLINLQILNVSNNHLSVLPHEICELKQLQTIDAKDNNLNCLPNNIGDMASLRTLNISGTNKVHYLPKSLAKVRTLEVLLLANTRDMEYPASFICDKGLEEIKKAICKDSGLEYIPPSHDLLRVLDPQQQNGSTNIAMCSTTEDNSLHDRAVADNITDNEIMEYEKMKENKRKQQLQMEKEIAESQMLEARLAAKSLSDRSKNNDAIIQENEKFDKMFKQQQFEVEWNRKKMFQILTQAESEANWLVEKLLKDKESSAKNERLLKELERQRLYEEEYYRVTQDDLDKLRKQETIDAMNLILQEDKQATALVKKYLAERDEAISQTRNNLSQEQKLTYEAIDRQKNDTRNLVNEILEKEQLQMMAFTALQYSVDETRQRILSQIREVERELAKITSVEAAQKKMKMELEQEVLANERQQLTDLLMILLKEKDEREKDLKILQNEMEQQRENDQIDFWLVQYQRLLDSQPEKLVERQSEMQLEVIKLLTRAGATHHIPSFARHRINNTVLLAQLTDKEIMKIGVFEVGLRKNILRLVEEELLPGLKKLTDDETIKTQKPVPLKPVPGDSAVLPADLAHLPAVPKPEETPTSSSEADNSEVVFDNECVICLDRLSNSVLLPCGHVCACTDCVNMLVTCPMCRETIAQKVRLYRS